MPVIAIDPKGDLGNLLLTFPRLAPGGFPALDRRGRGPARRADARRVCRPAGARPGGRGSRSPGQDGARIERLRATPPTSPSTPLAARAGLPVSVLTSFAAPPAARPERRGAARRAGGQHGDQPAVAGRRRRRSAQPRAHPRSRPCCRTRGRTAATSTSTLDHPGGPVARHSPRSASSISTRFFRSATGSTSRCGSTPCSPRRGSSSGSTASRSIRRACSTRRTAVRASSSSRSRTSAMQERMFFVSLLLQPDGRLDARADRHVEPARHPLHGRDRRLLPAGREPAVQAAAADAAQTGTRVRPRAWSWPRRIRSTSTTRACRTPARGSSGGCRPSATRRACSTGWRGPPRRRSIAPRRIACCRRSASACSCCTTSTRARPSFFRHAGRCRIFAARCRAIRFAP